MKTDQGRGSSNSRLDNLFRTLMLVTGIIMTILFLLSLVSMVEFPGMFKYLALGMVICGIGFFILRSIYSYRMTFRIKEKEKATR